VVLSLLISFSWGGEFRVLMQKLGLSEITFGIFESRPPLAVKH